MEPILRFFTVVFCSLFLGSSFVLLAHASSGSQAGKRKATETTYASIAYSKKTGAYGYALNKSSKGEARRVAKSECAKHARDCRSVAWTKLACVSLVTDVGGGYGASFGSNKGIANRDAMKKCSKYPSNKECKPLFAVCQR
ncbi:MAG: DUF4189 domain-containing protein [Pseudomonadota bacterium]